MLNKKSPRGGNEGRIDERRFRSLFGCSSGVVEELWRRLHPVLHGKKNVDGNHLLWSLLFLKLYGEEPAHTVIAGGVDENTFRKWSWIMIDLISNLENELVSHIVHTIYYIYILIH